MSAQNRSKSKSKYIMWGGLMSSCLLKVNINLRKIIRSCLPKNYEKTHASDPHIDFTGGNIYRINTPNIWDQKLSEATRDSKTVIANFSASWCGPCRTIFPFYKELSEKHSSLMFLLVDVDELAEFSTSWDISATPTFFFLRNGQEIDKFVGSNKHELEQKITKILSSGASPKI